MEVRAINQREGGRRVLTHFFPLEDHRLYEALAAQMVGFMQANTDNNGYNVYVGRALRREATSGSATNVDWVQSASLDIDPIRAEPQSPATKAELDRAGEVAHSLRDKWGGHLVLTGNGYQLWLPFADEPADVRGRRVWWSGAAQKWEGSVLGCLLDNAGCRVDPQFDIPRIVKLPGSLSVKGKATEDRPHRWATIELGTSHLTSEEIIGYAEEGQTDAAWQPSEVVPVPERFWGLLKGDDRVRESWLGIRGDFTSGRNSPSEQDMALVSICRRRGFTPAEARAILAQAPRGDRTKHSRYADITIAKVYGL